MTDRDDGTAGVDAPYRRSWANTAVARSHARFPHAVTGSPERAAGIDPSVIASLPSACRDTYVPAVNSSTIRHTGDDMVKKLAVAVAAAGAVLLAASPFALATGKPHHDHHDKGDRAVIGDVNSSNPQNGLVNVDDVNVLNGTNVCPDVGANVGGILGTLGSSDKSAISCDSLSDNNN